MSIATNLSDKVNPNLGKKVTTADILSYLREKYQFDAYKKQYVSFEELRMGSGFKTSSLQAIDFWCMDTWGGQIRTAYEIKTSRSDFLVEIKNPAKRRVSLLVSNYFYFITPKGMVKIEEIPPDCGLIEVWWTNNDHDVECTLNRNEQMLSTMEKSNAEYAERGSSFCYKPKLELIPDRKELLTAQTVLQAPMRDSLPPSWNFVSSLARRMHKEGK